jgi:hypothetical protein
VLAILVHDLALSVFYKDYDSDKRLAGINSKITDVTEFIRDAATSKPIAEMNAVIEDWRDCLPKNADDLYAWLIGQERGTLLSLLAVVAAQNVNGVQYGDGSRSGLIVPPSGANPRPRHDKMVRGELRGFLSRISKSAILATIA